MQVIAPFLAIVLRDTLQFTDYVSVADSMKGWIVEVWRPEIMYHDTSELREDLHGIRRL